jgi:Ca-activated chloride channel family protein
LPVIFGSAAALLSQISVQVGVVNIPVTVTGRGGAFVSGLHRENFRVLIDGQEKKIEYFSPEEEPARVLVLVENGPAVFLVRREHLAAANTLLDGLAPNDSVAVVAYSDVPRPLLDFTTDKRQAFAALNSLIFNIGTAELHLYDSMAQLIAREEPSEGKYAIVALTTGLDSSGSGPGSWDRLAEQLRKSNALVLPVALGGELRGAKMPRAKDATGEERVSFERSDGALKAIAAESGGQTFFPKSQKDFADAYRRIATLLRHQYSLGISVPAGGTGGGQHTIEVRIVDERGRPFDGKEAKPAYGINYRRTFAVR